MPRRRQAARAPRIQAARVPRILNPSRKDPDRVEVGRVKARRRHACVSGAASIPKAVIAVFALKVSNGAYPMSFDHLVGCCQKRRRNVDTE
jgi:hypothetical protein